MSLDTIYMIEEAVKELKIHFADVRIIFHNGDVKVVPYEPCTRD